MISLINLSKIYQPAKDVKVVALDNINVEIKTGEFVTVLGSSGSGKSTLMYQLGLLEKPTMGEIYFDNKKVSDLSDAEISYLRNQKIGFIFQQFNLILKLSVLDNILMPASYSKHGITKEKADYAHYLLKTFGIEQKKDSRPNQLSGGQQQRVAIARALVNQPSVIIADEPTGNLDSKTGLQIMELISKIHQEERKTIILVTHDTNIAKYAKRIIQIQDGKITKQ